MPRVSIITPTVNRAALLPAIWNCVRAQSVEDFEWLMHDGSSRPAPLFDTIHDARVRYMHVPTPMSIGAKRNALCDAASGNVIVQFDDDDYYAPHYIERMMALMGEHDADFVKLFGFFLYHRGNNRFAYWDLEHNFPLQYVFAPKAAIAIAPIRGGDARWGMGFSYVYRRGVWEQIRFADRDHGEDYEFANAAIARFKAVGMQDESNVCVHVIHAVNSSRALPQQILPLSVMAQLFPAFA